MAGLKEREAFSLGKMLQRGIALIFSRESSATRKEQLKDLKGKYAFVRTSSEIFARRKQIEVNWEG
jgi:hypothetical protein